MNQKAVGVAAILIAAVMWSIELILAKFSYANSDYLHTTAIGLVFAAITSLVYIFFTKGTLKIEKNHLPVLAVIALLATVVAETVYFYALTKTSIVNVIVLGHTQPIFIALFGYFFLKKDKLNKMDYTGMAFMIIAGVMVTTKTFQNLLSLNIGTSTDLLVIGAAVIWAVTAILARKYLHELNAGTVVFYRYTIAAFVLCSYIFITSDLKIANIYQILIGVVLGIGIIMYYESIKRIKAAQAGALELSAPFFAAVFGYLFFKESVTLMQISGMLLMFVGVYFLSKKEA
jgi:drug/metabolite transporter (DMT)-like permease